MLLISLILSAGNDTTSVHFTIIEGDEDRGSTDTEDGTGFEGRLPPEEEDDDDGPGNVAESEDTASWLLLRPRLDDLVLSLELDVFGGRVMRAEILASSGEPG